MPWKAVRDEIEFSESATSFDQGPGKGSLLGRVDHSGPPLDCNLPNEDSDIKNCLLRPLLNRFLSAPSPATIRSRVRSPSRWCGELLVISQNGRWVLPHSSLAYNGPPLSVKRCLSAVGLGGLGEAQAVSSAPALLYLWARLYKARRMRNSITKQIYGVSRRMYVQGSVVGLGGPECEGLRRVELGRLYIRGVSYGSASVLGASLTISA